MPQDIFRALPFVNIDAATLSGVYQPLNAPGFAYPIVYMRIVNRSNVDLQLSYDGVTTHDYIMADSETMWMPPICSLPNNKAAAFPAYTTLYGICASATGHIYIAAYYV